MTDYTKTFTAVEPDGSARNDNPDFCANPHLRGVVNASGGAETSGLIYQGGQVGQIGSVPCAYTRTSDPSTVIQSDQHLQMAEDKTSELLMGDAGSAIDYNTYLDARAKLAAQGYSENSLEVVALDNRRMNSIDQGY